MAMHQEHHIPAACPACGTDLLEPERYDDGRAFVCDVCGAHVQWRDGHVRLSWGHGELHPVEPHDRPHRVVPRGAEEGTP